MMKEFKTKTIIITKEGWKFLKNYDRSIRNYSKHSEEWLEKMWHQIERNGFKNDGANSKEYPIASNEIRVDNDSFNMSLDIAKNVLVANGFNYREDGYTIKGFGL